MLDEFYNHLDLVGVSAMTGAGIDDFLKAVDGKVEEYERDYRPEMEKARAKREGDKLKNKQKELDKLMKDMNVGKAKEAKEDPNVISDIESSDEENGLLERDEDEQMGEDDDDEGLQKRYEKTLKETGKKDTKADDESLQRYLRASNV
jgi:hypothetical protein